MDALTNHFSLDTFLQVLDGVKQQQARALEAYCEQEREAQANTPGSESVNSKFACQTGVFEGAFGTIEDFLAGLDAIGLPQPDVYKGMQLEFTGCDDADCVFTTSNYGGIETTPKIEWEFVVCPDTNKEYPGGRIPIEIEMFLWATAAKNYQEKLDNSQLDEGQRATVEVIVLRRCKAQLDTTFLRQVLKRPVVQQLVD